jgi:hypothetical protein
MIPDRSRAAAPLRCRARRDALRGVVVGFVFLVVASIASTGRGEEPVAATEGAWNPGPPTERTERIERRERWQRQARREAMRGLARALPGARPVERLAIARQAMRLPAEERRALRERLRGFDALAPDERRALVAELEGLLARADEDIARFERNLGRWEQLSEAERERYRERLRRLRALPPEERRALLEEWERSRRKTDAP